MQAIASIQRRFLVAWSLEEKNESMIIENAKASGYIRIDTAKLGLHPKKPLLCIWWNICWIVTFVLKPGQTVNANLVCG